jgi:hypothetical protein
LEEIFKKKYDPHCPSHVFGNVSFVASAHVCGYKFGDAQIEDELQSLQTCPYSSCHVYIRTPHIKHQPYKKTLNKIRKMKIKWVGMKAYCP